MNDEGKVLSPSSQNSSQLKAELTARKLSTEGRQKDLRRRLMVRLSLSGQHCMLSNHIVCGVHANIIGGIGTWEDSTAYANAAYRVACLQLQPQPAVSLPLG